MTWILLPIYSIYPFSGHRLLIRLFVGGDPRGHDHNPHIRTPKSPHLLLQGLSEISLSLKPFLQFPAYQILRLVVNLTLFLACVNSQLTKHLPPSKIDGTGKQLILELQFFPHFCWVKLPPTIHQQLRNNTLVAPFQRTATKTLQSRG